ncbi:hypothetical protein MMC07_000098 [Pseudocyphellaria aurata]|nr:hypothetical protein [Pseudocyphellaria aurata]
MDAENRAGSLLTESEWERLGYDVNLPNLRPNNLAREISPVFQYMDEGDQIRWTGLEREDCQIIEPVCRLASAMIESPASLAFLHALLYSPRANIALLSQRVGYPCHEFRRSEISVIPDSEDPRLALKRLAPNVSWILLGREKMPGRHGSTSNTWVDCTIVDNGRNGFQSSIELRKSLIQELSELSRQADRVMQTLSYQFFVAKILCHEVVHAINLAIDPALVTARRMDLARLAIGHSPSGWLQWNEPFFEDQAQPELGYCWENEVFGGSITHSKVEKLMLICKWPNHWGIEPDSIQSTPRRAGFKATQTEYIIPAHFIHNIQQQVFWDRLDPVNAISLRAQKMVGIRTELPPGSWTDALWEPSTSSEGVWSADEIGWVYRKEDADAVARQYSTANLASTTKWVMELPDPEL